MIVKKHTKEGKLVLAICDKSIKGQKFEEENSQLDLSSSFYDGKEIGEEELQEIIKKTYLINAVGEKSIDFLIKKGIVEKEDIKKISGVPYCHVLIGKEL